MPRLFPPRQFFILVLSALSLACGDTTQQPIEGDVAVISTSLGAITIELNAAQAPISVQNFRKYVALGFYDQIIFHRVINGFVIQAGRFDQDRVVKPPFFPPIRNEGYNGLSNLRATVAMWWRTDSNSATTEFFINTIDNAFLDFVPGKDGYAVFGMVIDGMGVVDSIKVVEIPHTGDHPDMPVVPVVIDSIRLISG